MELDLVEYAKGIAQQANELATIMAERASKLAESAPSAAPNTRIAPALREIAAEMESWADSMGGDCRHVPQAVLYRWARQLRNA